MATVCDAIWETLDSQSCHRSKKHGVSLTKHATWQCQPKCSLKSFPESWHQRSNRVRVHVTHQQRHLHLNCQLSQISLTLIGQGLFEPPPVRMPSPLYHHRRPPRSEHQIRIGSPHPDMCIVVSLVMDWARTHRGKCVGVFKDTLTLTSLI